MPTDVALNQACIGEVPEAAFTLVAHTADVDNRQVAWLERCLKAFAECLDERFGNCVPRAASADDEGIAALHKLDRRIGGNNRFFCHFSSYAPSNPG